MSKKKPAKATKSAGVRNLKTKSLSARTARTVKGGGTAAKVNVEYKPQKADGTLDAGVHFKYDLKGNREG